MVVATLIIVASWGIALLFTIPLTDGFSNFMMPLSLPSGFKKNAVMSMTVAGVPTTTKTAVIVGGGPVGLATALTLAKSEASSFNNVVVLEKRKAGAFESEKAYLYLLDGRGQKLTDSMGITQSLASSSVSSKQFTELNELLTDGTQNTKKLPVLMSSGVEKFWMPRKVLLDGFFQAIDAHNQLGKGSTIQIFFDSRVTSLNFDSPDGIVVGIHSNSTEGEGRGDGKKEHFFAGAELVVGADGMNSFVRNVMAAKCACAPTATITKREEDGNANVNGNCYEMVEKNSDSAGLLFKMITPRLRFPMPMPEGMSTADLVHEDEVQHCTPHGTMEVNSRFAAIMGDSLLRHSDREEAALEGEAQQRKEKGHCEEDHLSVPEKAYAIRGTGNTDTSRLSMGLLPVRGDAPRTCNFIAKPGHELWSIDSVAGLKSYFARQFPQMTPLSDFVGEEELQRFVEASPGTFPKPQYCPSAYGFAVCGNDSRDRGANEEEKEKDDRRRPLRGIFRGLYEGLTAETEKKAGLVLLGDSLHAFPPDLGQGVNSGLEDVFVLGKVLEECRGDIGRALPLFEERRMPEVKALVDIMVYGFPYQYSQGPWYKKLASTVNFIVRLLLSKALPFLISPPAFFMVQDSTLSYQKIRRRAHRTTLVLVVMVAAIIAVVFVPKSAAVGALSRVLNHSPFGMAAVPDVGRKLGLVLGWLATHTGSPDFPEPGAAILL
jgi:2-polyprenyl-6-methoxyphenol hydroxylase-like FAD-dependent oxidoreductase